MEVQKVTVEIITPSQIRIDPKAEAEHCAKPN